MEANKRYKYVHFLWRNEVKFNGPLVQLIDDPQNGFNIEDHVFITPHTKVYESLKDYGNVKLDDSGKNLFNVYSECCDWIFSHSFRSIWDVLTIKKKNLHKIIWRSWGGYIAGFRYRDGQVLQNAVKRVINKHYIRQIDGFAAIGYANVVDVLDIRKTFKEIPLYRIPYMTRENFQYILDVLQEPKREDGYVHVLLGHRGTSEGKHAQLLETLKKYEGEKMRIFIPLSYGDKAYIEEVKAYVAENGFSNVQILDQFMPYVDYAKLLYDMDLAIFAGADSYALGNIWKLLRFDKKIFLNRNGVIAEAFDHEGTPYSCVDEIQTMDFASFSKPVEYPAGVIDNFVSRDYAGYINRWKDLLEIYS